MGEHVSGIPAVCGVCGHHRLGLCRCTGDESYVPALIADDIERAMARGRREYAAQHGTHWCDECEGENAAECPRNTVRLADVLRLHAEPPLPSKDE